MYDKVLCRSKKGNFAYKDKIPFYNKKADNRDALFYNKNVSLEGPIK